MSDLLKLLLGFFSLRADDDPPADTGDQATDNPDADIDNIDLDAADAAGAQEDEGDAEQEDDPEAARAAAAKAAKEAKEAKDAQRAADDRAEQLAQQLAAHRMRAQGASPEQQLWGAEESKLRDPKTTDLEKWQIQSNRTLRQSRQQSQVALFQAQDLADRTQFDQLSATRPAIAKYAQRVETELQRIRQSGQNAPRAAILRYIVGEDVISGALKPKKAAAAPAQTVDRGRSPAARSDVPARGRMTEAQRREKRLENVIL